MRPLKLNHAFLRRYSDPAAVVEAQRREGFQPRPDLPPWPLTPPVDWAADPYGDVNWRFQLNAWRMLDPLLTVHARLGDGAALDEAVALILDWSDFTDRHPDHALFWNDMGAGLRASRLAYVITQKALEGEAMRPTRAALKRVARRHLRRLRQPGFISDTNHGLFQLHGAMALCKAIPRAPEAQGGEAWVEERFGRLLRSQFGREGVHLEHSPYYHRFALRTLRRFLGTRWYDAAPGARELLAAGQGPLAWMTFPDGLLSAAGDSERMPVTLEPPPKSDAVVGRLFGEAGYACVRSDWRAPIGRASMLFVTGAYHSAMHKHADELSFELFERGRMVVVDSGKLTYSSGDWRAYTRSARAHNSVDLTPLREDNGWRREAPTGGVLTALERQDWGWRIEGRLERPLQRLVHARTFLYRPGEWLVLLDRVRAPTIRTFRAWLHLAPELEAVRDGDGWRFSGGRIDYVSPAALELELERVRGATEPQIQGWVATGYEDRAANDALGCAFEGREGLLATVVTLDGATPPKLALSDGRLTVSRSGRVIAETGPETS